MFKQPPMFLPHEQKHTKKNFNWCEWTIFPLPFLVFGGFSLPTRLQASSCPHPLPSKNSKKLILKLLHAQGHCVTCEDWRTVAGVGEWCGWEAASMPCPTARGRGQLEWDSGQLAQRRLQAGAGDWRFSCSLLACRFLLSFCDLCTLEVNVSKQTLHWSSGRLHLRVKKFD